MAIETQPMLSNHDVNKLDQILEASRNVMNKLDNSTVKINHNNYDDTNDYDSPYQEMYEEQAIPQQRNTNSRLPKVIMDAMEPVITEDINRYKTPPKVQKPKVVMEEKKQSYNSPIVDYSLIKMIVKECLAEQLNNKQSINESQNLKQIRIKDDGNMRLVTESGDVYETNLVYKGKIKSKK